MGVNEIIEQGYKLVQLKINIGKETVTWKLQKGNKTKTIKRNAR